LAKAYEYTLKEFYTTYGALLDFVFGSPSYLRKEIVNHMDERIVKEKLKEADKKLEEMESRPRKAITGLLLEGILKERSE